MKINLVSYAHGEPYETTQKLLNDSIKDHTSHEVILHQYSQEVIQECEWYQYIKDFPNRTIYRKHDDYFCAWKQFCVLDVLRKADEGDLVYYVDGSRYAITGFTENLDKFFEYADNVGGIFASVTDDIRNRDDNTGTNYEFWKLLGMEDKYDSLLGQRHPLTAWYILKADERTIKIFEEMCELLKMITPDGRSLVEFHHTQEQTVHCATMIKYDIPAFYAPGYTHNEMKDRNLVVKIINENTREYFMERM